MDNLLNEPFGTGKENQVPENETRVEEQLRWAKEDRELHEFYVGAYKADIMGNKNFGFLSRVVQYIKQLFGGGAADGVPAGRQLKYREFRNAVGMLAYFKVVAAMHPNLSQRPLAPITDAQVITQLGELLKNESPKLQRAKRVVEAETRKIEALARVQLKNLIRREVQGIMGTLPELNQVKSDKTFLEDAAEEEIK